jgi:hypothetical protein
MTQLINDQGFVADDFATPYAPFDAAEGVEARRSGFDEVEIPDDLAARQPQDQWLARANWQEHNYQARLRG